MKDQPLRTSVIGSYPFPGWLEFAAEHSIDSAPPTLPKRRTMRWSWRCTTRVGGWSRRRDRWGTDAPGFQPLVLWISRRRRMPRRLSPRRFGPAAHDQRGKHRVIGELRAPRGLGAVEEFDRLKRLHSRLGGGRRGRHAQSQRARALHPERPAAAKRPLSGSLGTHRGIAAVVREELEALVAAGCREISVDEPSMSCYAYGRTRGDSWTSSIARSRRSSDGRASARICALATTRAGPSACGG